MPPGGNLVNVYNMTHYTNNLIDIIVRDYLPITIIYNGVLANKILSHIDYINLLFDRKLLLYYFQLLSLYFIFWIFIEPCFMILNIYGKVRIDWTMLYDT